MFAGQASTPSRFQLILAYATVYIVWGSTYFFIQRALSGFPPFFLGAFRFLAAALIMMFWAAMRGEKLFTGKQLITPIITGFLLLFLSSGIVIWVEQFLPSALVAIMISSTPICFVALDYPKWRENLTNKSTLIGLVVGFGGVLMLFWERIVSSSEALNNSRDLSAMMLIFIGSLFWVGGSLYSKYQPTTNSSMVNSSWQMMSAGLAFIPCIFLHNEMAGLQFSRIPLEAWLSVLYLIFFGSIAGFSAYVWLLKEQPATKVSTHAYVNPLVAIILGVFFAREIISGIQLLGLAVILASVLLINLHTYQKSGKSANIV